MTLKKKLQKERFDLSIEGDKSAVLKLLQKKPRNKYGAIKKKYNGVTYHSTKEARYAMFLDRKIQAKEVERWERQIVFKLMVGGVFIANYILDFQVWYMDGTVKYIDVKGMKKGQAFYVFQIKQKLMKALYNIEVELS